MIKNIGHSLLKRLAIGNLITIRIKASPYSYMILPCRPLANPIKVAYKESLMAGQKSLTFSVQYLNIPCEPSGYECYGFPKALGAE